MWLAFISAGDISWPQNQWREDLDIRDPSLHHQRVLGMGMGMDPVRGVGMETVWERKKKKGKYEGHCVCRRSRDTFYSN
jgi:hypothetical protein